MVRRKDVKVLLSNDTKANSKYVWDEINALVSDVLHPRLHKEGRTYILDNFWVWIIKGKMENNIKLSKWTRMQREDVRNN